MRGEHRLDVEKSSGPAQDATGATGMAPIHQTKGIRAGASAPSLHPIAPVTAKRPSEVWTSPLEGGMPIHFGEGAADSLPGLLDALRPDKIVIVSDNRTFGLHGAFLLQLLSAHFAPEIILIPEGEGEKSMANLETICQGLFERGITKSSVVVNFGGGVVLNIGGLSASLVYRGIRFVQVPTTLMAQ